MELTTSWKEIGSDSLFTVKYNNKTYTGYLKLDGKYNSQNTTNNTTSVSFRLRVYCSLSGSHFSNASGSATFTGAYDDTKNIAGITYNTGDVIKTITKTVTHNNDGTKSIEIGGKVTGSHSATISKVTVDLPTIKRASVLNQPSNFTFGDTISATYTKYVSSFTCNLNLKIGSGTFATRTNYTSGATITLTSSEIEAAYNLSPNTSTPTVTFELITKSGSTTIGSASKKNVTATIPNTIQPTITSVTLVDSLNNAYGEFVQGKSTITGTVTCSPSSGASIKTIGVIIDGNQTFTSSSTTFTTAPITHSGTNQCQVTFYDSRNRHTTDTTTFTVLKYSEPTIENFRVTRCDSLGNETDEGSYIKINATASITPLNNINTKSFVIQYKLHSVDTWTTLTTYDTTYTYTLTDSIHGGFSPDNAYDFKLIATDDFSDPTNPIEAKYELPTAKAVLDFYKDGTGIAVGKVAQTPNLFEVAYNTQINGTLKLAESDGDNAIEMFDLTGTPRYDSTQSYSVGDYCVYNNSLYKCVAATTGDFDSDDWSSTNIMTEIGSGGGGGGGTSNYNDLTNKPQINSVTLSGNKSLSDLGINIPTQTSQLINNSNFVVATSYSLDNIYAITSTSNTTYTGIKNCIDNKLPFKVYEPDLSGTNIFEVKTMQHYSNVYEFSYDRETSIETIKLTYSGSSVTVTDSYTDLQTKITNSNKIDYSLIDNTPTKVSDLTNDSGYITGITSNDVTTALGYTPLEVKKFAISDILAITTTSDTTFTDLETSISNGNPIIIENISGDIFDYEVIYIYTGHKRYDLEYKDEYNNIVNIKIEYPGGTVTVTQTTTALQEEITASNKLDYSLLDNTPTIPTVPTTVSSFTNDAGYITSSSLPTKVSDLTNDTGFITSSYHDSSKQDSLVSGTNIKTINNQSLLGSGNITIQGGGGGTATDVQINGSSIVSNDVANIQVDGTYDSSNNKIATMSSLPTNSNIVDLIYPVGSIYMSVNSTSPQTLFGGTWAQIEDTFLLSAGSTYSAGATGGSASHTLSINEMPSHTHNSKTITGSITVRATDSVTSANANLLQQQSGILSRASDSAVAGYRLSATTYRSAVTSQYNQINVNATHEHDAQGGGQAFSTLPPYMVVYMWQRTA